MTERTYKCVSANAVCNRIWKADFDLDSFNELVERDDPDTVIATVGMSDYSGPERRLSLVATLHKHQWSNEIADCLIQTMSNEYESLDEWLVVKKDFEWVITLKWRD